MENNTVCVVALDKNTKKLKQVHNAIKQMHKNTQNIIEALVIMLK